MSGPLLPSDLQLDVGMSAEEVRGYTSKDPSSKGGITYETTTDSSEDHWCRAPASNLPSKGSPSVGIKSFSSIGEHSSTFGTTMTMTTTDYETLSPDKENALGLFSDTSPQQCSFAASSNSTSGFDELSTPCRCSDQSPVDVAAHERSEVSLTSAIAAISYMASAASSSPFPSLEGLAVIPHHKEIESGEKQSAVEGGRNNGGVTHSRSQPTLFAGEKGTHQSNSSDSTAASPDLDINTLLRILTPQAGRKKNQNSLNDTMNKRFDTKVRSAEDVIRFQSNSEQQQSPQSSEEPGSDDTQKEHDEDDDDNTPCQLSIPLFGTRAAHLLADLPQRFIACSSEVALSQLIEKQFSKDDIGGPHTATSCTELGRRSSEEGLADEGSDTVEPLDSFLQHTLGSTRRRFPSKQLPYFQSPSSGTFLNNSYYKDDDAQNALTKLLECFSAMNQQDTSQLDAATAAAAALKGKRHQTFNEATVEEGQRSEGLRHTRTNGDASGSIHQSSSEFLNPTASAQQQSLYLSPIGTSMSSQESLSPCNRSQFPSIESQRTQGAATAPAAMMTDAEAMLASLLNSLGAGGEEEAKEVVRDESQVSNGSSQKVERHRGAYDWAQLVDDDETELNQISRAHEYEQQERRWDEHHVQDYRASSRPHLFVPPTDSSYYRSSASDTRDTAHRRVGNGNDDANWRINLPPSSSSSRRSSHSYPSQHRDYEGYPYTCHQQASIGGALGQPIERRPDKPSMYQPGDLRGNEWNMQQYQNQYYNTQPMDHPHPHHHQHHHHHHPHPYHHPRHPHFTHQSHQHDLHLAPYCNRDRSIGRHHHPNHPRVSVDGFEFGPGGQLVIADRQQPQSLHNDSNFYYHNTCHGIAASSQLHLNEMGHPSFPDIDNAYCSCDVNSYNTTSNIASCDDGNKLMKRVYSDDRDRMVYVSWIPKKARAYNTIDKRKMELDLKRKLREDLTLIGLTKVLLFPPKGVHCKLIFDSRPSAANFMTLYGGENRSEETERWKIDLCRIYHIDMNDKFDKTVFFPETFLVFIDNASESTTDQKSSLTVADLLEKLKVDAPKLQQLLPHCLVAVNLEYAKPQQTITPTDEISLIPPVSGG